MPQSQTGALVHHLETKVGRRRDADSRRTKRYPMNRNISSTPRAHAALMRRNISLLLIAAAATACGLFSRPPGGDLRVAAEELARGSYSVGEFRASWRTDESGEPALVLSREDAPDRTLWDSAPGRAFISAARGTETVEESRGMFFIEDEISRECSDQNVDSVRAETDLVFSGTLDCDGETVPYDLTLQSTREGHLRFDLQIKNPSWNRSYLIYAAAPDEGFYGFGEQFSRFDMRGEKLPIFVMEQGIGRGAQPITIGADLTAKAGGKWWTSYASVPHYISSRLRSLALENYEYSSFDLRDDEVVVVEVFAPRMTGRIFAGDSPLKLIEEYTEFAGRMRVLPDWIHRGAIVGMQGGSEKVWGVYDRLKQLGTPLAAFWLQDWEGQRITSFGKQLWWNWELDRERYPEWDKKRAELKANGVELMVYVNPFLVDVSEKPNARRNLFKEALAAGYLIQHQDGSPYLILNTDFSAGLIDLSNPAARAWIKQVIKDELISTGALGWMADFGEALPYDAKLHSGESAAYWHNLYPEEWQRINREAIQEAGLGDQVVFFSRSGYTRSPGLTTLFWLGDQLVSWDEHDGIKTAVTGLVTGGISGYSLNHSDIGGYTAITNPIKNYHRSKELLQRWTELSAFNVVFRTHEGNRPDENFQIYSDDEMLRFFDRFARVFAALADYRKGLVQDAARLGHPVVRAMFVEFPNDPEVRGIVYEQFMFGPDFLVAPVLDEGETTVEAYLPAGEWIHLWSGATYGDAARGVRIRVDAPLGQPGVFYKKGSRAGETLRARLASENLL